MASRAPSSNVDSVQFAAQANLGYKNNLLPPTTTSYFQSKQIVVEKYDNGTHISLRIDVYIYVTGVNPKEEGFDKNDFEKKGGAIYLVAVQSGNVLRSADPRMQAVALTLWGPMWTNLQSFRAFPADGSGTPDGDRSIYNIDFSMALPMFRGNEGEGGETSFTAQYQDTCTRNKYIQRCNQGGSQQSFRIEYDKEKVLPDNVPFFGLSVFKLTTLKKIELRYSLSTTLQNHAATEFAGGVLPLDLSFD